MIRKLKGQGPFSQAINEHEDRLNRLDPSGGDSRTRFTSEPRGTINEGTGGNRRTTTSRPIDSSIPRYI